MQILIKQFLAGSFVYFVSRRNNYHVRQIQHIKLSNTCTTRIFECNASDFLLKQLDLCDWILSHTVEIHNDNEISVTDEILWKTKIGRRNYSIKGNKVKHNGWLIKNHQDATDSARLNYYISKHMNKVDLHDINTFIKKHL